MREILDIKVTSLRNIILNFINPACKNVGVTEVQVIPYKRTSKTFEIRIRKDMSVICIKENKKIICRQTDTHLPRCKVIYKWFGARLVPAEPQQYSTLSEEYLPTTYGERREGEERIDDTTTEPNLDKEKKMNGLKKKSKISIPQSIFFSFSNSNYREGEEEGERAERQFWRKALK